MIEKDKSKWILAWLATGCVMVYTMVLLGGITRMTGSGLSITEWNLVMGTFPPMSEAGWQEAFEKYQSSPQFQKVNYDFTISEFKSIFWWEYLHRLNGRLIGIVFLVPFCVFVARAMMTRRTICHCLGIFLLGGLQGAIGWYMVKSGLVDNPRVSHFRLATHLVTAFITFGYIFWIFLDLYYDRKNSGARNFLRTASAGFFVLVLLQVVYGAFTAGLHAGKIYNTFPKMGGEWIPDSVSAMGSFMANMTENLAGVQLVHRCLAWLLLISGILLCFYTRKYSGNPVQKKAAAILIIVLCSQFLLGVFTLLYAAPILLGVLHQTGAFFLFASSLYLLHSSSATEAGNSSRNGEEDSGILLA